METKSLKLDYLHYDSPAEMDKADQLLVDRAKKACEGSFAEFSGFKVGCALELENGTIVTSANQESDVLPVGSCAERIALYYARSNYKDLKINKIAIAAASERFNFDSFVSPCGMCRQSIADVEKAQGAFIKIIMASGKECVVVNSASELLPFTFKL